MHHLIYPSQDTFITNRPNYSNKNFGIDEILQVGVDTEVSKVKSSTTSYSYNGQVTNQTFQSFTGTITGSFFLSGSSVTTSGSYSSYAGIVYTGSVSGSDILSKYNIRNVESRFIDRSLVKFNISAISSSISSGNISNPTFSLKLKTSRGTDLPINYTLYAYAISQSWVMGDGYSSDGGSNIGASWYYRDLSAGIPWNNTASSIVFGTDFITYPNLSSASFNAGGGTWFTESQYRCSQSFSHQWSDINMDIYGY